jgi:hypothetical protein
MKKLPTYYVGRLSSLYYEWVSMRDIALHLARHGVKAEVMQDTASANFVGEVLLKQAERQPADLIVTGPMDIRD